MRCLKAVLLLILAGGSPAWALEPSEILLIANGNAKVSQQLAHYYAEQRKVPPENLVLVDVGAQEEISREGYRDNIAKPVRAFLEKNDPQHKIKCLLTFTGLPIRISNNVAQPETQDELLKIQTEQAVIEPKILPRVKSIEALVKELDPAYKPPTDQASMQAMAVRVDFAVTRLIQVLNAEKDESARRKVLERLFIDIEPLTGPSGRLQRIMFRDLPLAATQPTTAPTTAATAASTLTPAEQAELPADRRDLLVSTQARMNKTAIAMGELMEHQDNPATRVQMRELARDELGLIGYDRVLETQMERLNPSDTGAAVDNELALLLWNDEYPLYRWIENPLYYRFAGRRMNLPRVLMTMRLDGPHDDTAYGIIASSIKAEQTGLGGKIVIDCKGMKAKKDDGSIDPYGEYDETLQRLAKLLKEKTSLEVVYDDHRDVLKPGSVKDVGLYIGWYALRNYTPACEFRPGAVGYHVASLEMISLKAAGERGWVAGLLNDGVAATLGAVNEPYLHSFPKADEFFPLLLTGKLTLAEVYWRTNPLTSWQISMIGDPLYTPFKTNPAMKEEDLPGDLRLALHPGVTLIGPQMLSPTTMPLRRR